MKHHHKISRVAIGVAYAAAFIGGPSVAALSLTGQGFVQYGDAQSYSMPVLQLQNCGALGAGPGGSCQFFVNSTPGQIKGLTVLGTGSDGTGVVENFSGMDNAYATPSGASGSTFWRPSATTYQGTTGAVVNNGANTWDSSLAALKSYLTTGPNIEDMIFFFNNNQEKSGGTFNESLAAWAQITVKNAGGAVIGTYDFTNNLGKYATVAEGGGGVLSTSGGNVANYSHPGSSPSNPYVGDRTKTDYVLSGGNLCLVIDATQTPSGTDVNGDLVSCVGIGSGSKGVITIDHNLGANEAAYAVMFPELNTQLKGLFNTLGTSDLAAYTMSVDLRLGCDPNDYDAGGPDAGLLDTSKTCDGKTRPVEGYGRNLNNGFEQIFISKCSDVVNLVPEPGSLLLAGLALVGLAGIRRRA